METMSEKLLYLTGKIYTGNENWPLASAALIRRGRFIFVGSKEEGDERVEELQGYGHEVDRLNVTEGMILPGMTEGHAHVTQAVDMMHGASLYGLETVEEYIAALREYLAGQDTTKEGFILFGNGLVSTALAGVEDKAALLDAISTEFPIIVRGEDLHTIWHNTKAITLIPDEIKNEYSGKIKNNVRDEIRKHKGLLVEEDADIMVRSLPLHTKEEFKEAILYYQEMALSNGILYCFEPFLAPQLDFATRVEAYHELEEEGKLIIYFELGYTIYPDNNLEAAFKEACKLRTDLERDEHVSLNWVKVFVDGVLENHTAFLSEPYCDSSEAVTGSPLWDFSRFEELLFFFQRNGFKVHVHSIGDAATDFAIKAAIRIKDRLAFEFRGCPTFAITHLQVLRPNQMELMARYRIHAVVNPYWHFKDPMYFDALEVPYLGEERAAKEYPVASLLEKKVTVSAASDWPVSVPADTMKCLSMLVTRQYPGDVETEPLGEQEKLTPLQALSVMTAGGYEQLRLSKKGKIMIDNDADFVIIDKDVLTMEPQRIFETRVLSAYVHGQKVWEKL